MKAAFALAAAGVVVVQGAVAPGYGTPSYDAKCPKIGETGPDGRYGCNPAHQYPEGQVCQEDNGCYYICPGGHASSSATPSASVDVPEHRTASASATPTSGGKCPAAGEHGPDGRYSCNPAHKYPEGQICQEENGCYYLRNPGPGVSATPSVSVDVPVYRTASASATPTSGGKCPAAGEHGPDGRYSCNPAHKYPEGQICQEENGCYYLRTPGPGVSGTPFVSVDVPQYRTSALIVPCPEPTTYVHSASTYIIKTATTLTIPVTYPAPSEPAQSTSGPVASVDHPIAPPATNGGAPPATTGGAVPPPPPYKPTTVVASPSLPVSRNATATQSIATYTGAAAQQTAGAFLAVAAIGALFL